MKNVIIKDEALNGDILREIELKIDKERMETSISIERQCPQNAAMGNRG